MLRVRCPETAMASCAGTHALLGLVTAVRPSSLVVPSAVTARRSVRMPCVLGDQEQASTAPVPVLHPAVSRPWSARMRGNRRQQDADTPAQTPLETAGRAAG